MMKDEQDIAEKIVVDVARLPERGETLEGEVDIVDLDEEFVKPFGGVRYCPPGPGLWLGTSRERPS